MVGNTSIMKKQKTKMVENNLSSWSDPPQDILCAIVVRLLSVCEYKDVVRLCAVCKSWRVIIYRMYLEPIDVFCEVAYCLQYEDLVRLSSVCKFWRFIIYKVYLKLRYTLRNPGLMLYTRCLQDDQQYDLQYDQILSFFDTSVLKFRRINLKVSREEVRKFSQLDSKYGFLLLYSQTDSKPALVLYNPLNSEIMQLPQLNLWTYQFYVRLATFTGPPTSSDCTIFVFCDEISETESCIVGTCKLGDDVWIFRKLTGRRWNAIREITNMAYVNGIFCFVLENSEYRSDWSVELATLDVTTSEEESSWVVDYTPITVVQKNTSYWLVESDGKLLLAIFQNHLDATLSYWHVYEFNWSRKNWTRVPSLGNRVLILHRLRHYMNLSLSFACSTAGDDSKLSNAVITTGGIYTYSSDGIWRIASN